MSAAALNWISGRDTGASSIAIWAHMMGAKSDGSHPLDPADFGRCYRLLVYVPEWAPRIGEMAVYSTTWLLLSGAWFELTALFERETGCAGLATYNARGNAPELYARMLELRQVRS